MFDYLFAEKMATQPATLLLALFYFTKTSDAETASDDAGTLCDFIDDFYVCDDEFVTVDDN